mgnify:CR=1 FL=1
MRLGLTVSYLDELGNIGGDDKDVRTLYHSAVPLIELQVQADVSATRVQGEVTPLTGQVLEQTQHSVFNRRVTKANTISRYESLREEVLAAECQHG